MAQRQHPVRRKAQPSETPVSIPDKLYFRIGDVADLCGLPAYVLRFWETEFPQLKPNKGGTGQRLYRKRDVETVLEIKHLLYGERFTIAGARRLLAENRRSSKGAQASIPEDRRDRGKSSPSRGQSTTAQGLSKALKAPPAKPLQDKPKISELRAEMRELLTILGSDRAPRKPSPPPVKREAKKTIRADEPTLF